MPESEVVGPEERWIDWPFVDTSIEVSGRKQKEGLHGRGSFTTTVAGIVAGLDTEATAVADSDQNAPDISLGAGIASLSVEGERHRYGSSICNPRFF